MSTEIPKNSDLELLTKIKNADFFVDEVARYAADMVASTMIEGYLIEDAKDLTTMVANYQELVDLEEKVRQAKVICNHIVFLVNVRRLDSRSIPADAAIDLFRNFKQINIT